MRAELLAELLQRGAPLAGGFGLLRIVVVALLVGAAVVEQLDFSLSAG